MCEDHVTCGTENQTGRRLYNKKISIRHGTWFSKTKLDFGQVLQLTYMLVYNYEQKAIMREPKISKKTVSQWNVFLKHIIVQWLQYESKPLGGQGKTVEIDESEFGKRKYSRGWAIEGQWVFSGIEWESKNILLVIVRDKTLTTLTKIIKEWILLGSTIISDCWKEYKDLDKEGYEHLMVNHSISFVDEGTGAHTNSMECTWRHTKQFLPNYNRKKNKFIEYLGHFKFPNYCKHVDFFNKILFQISNTQFGEKKIVVNLKRGVKRVRKMNKFNLT